MMDDDSEANPHQLLTSLDAPCGQSVLSVIANSSYIFAGAQSGCIYVWNVNGFQLENCLQGHTSSVLALQFAPERHWLFSSSSDGTVRVWNTKTFKSVYVIHSLHDNIGDIFSIAWSSELSRLYFGCQDTSIISMYLPTPDSIGACNSTSSLVHIERPHRFFDSSPQTSRNASPRLPRPSSENPLELDRPKHLYVSEEDVHLHAHYGYVYSMLLTKNAKGNVLLVTGAGDEIIKIWCCGSPRPIHHTKLESLSNPSQDQIASPLIDLSDDSDCSVDQESDDNDSTYSGPTLRGSGLKRKATLPGLPDTAILTMAVRDNTLYAGHQNGILKIWDLETFSCLATLSATKGDLLCISVTADGRFFTLDSNGLVTSWTKTFAPIYTWPAHKGIGLASTTLQVNSENLLITGGSDHRLNVWRIPACAGMSMSQSSNQVALDKLSHDLSQNLEVTSVDDTFLYRHFDTLRKFVAFKSISLHSYNTTSKETTKTSTDSTELTNSGTDYDTNNKYIAEVKEECRQCARFLRTTLAEMGADSYLLPGIEGTNQMVLAIFRGSSKLDKPSGGRRKRVLYYGHYDVVKQGSESQWKTPPFVLTGENGWLYGRGISDNKGPIIAVADAAATLLKNRELDVDLLMLLEGEEESGSTNFQDTLKYHQDLIGPVDVVLVSNSYWIGEDIPCMIWGMRGVIHATVEVSSNRPDAHSGVHGGSITHEPLVDLSRVIASLFENSDSSKVAIKGFYDSVRVLTDEERQTYMQILDRCKGNEMKRFLESSDITCPIESLIRRWREPSLSVHNVQVSGPSHSTVIPKQAKATVSIRIVPDQSREKVCKALEDYITTSFKSLGSSNSISTKIDKGTSDYWVGSPKSIYSNCMANCIKDEWNVDPLWIREGGSVPSISFLARHFDVEAVHIPMGQSSDSAHLPNERIRCINLERGRNIVLSWLARISSL